MKKVHKRTWIWGSVIVFVTILSAVFGYQYFLNEAGAPPKTNDNSQETSTEIEELENSDLNDDPLITAEAEPYTPPPEVQPALTANWWEYPDEISFTTKGGDDLLVLVNKQYKLRSTYIPSGLTTLNEVSCRLNKTLYVRSLIVNELGNLCNAAQSDGVDLSIVSAYRSYATQQSTYQYWVNYNGGDVAAADTVSARAGHSQHQLGTTIDFSTSSAGDALGDVFNSTTAAKWLENNAWKYGFALSYPKDKETITGYSYEGWHFRFIGVENAKEMVQSLKILEVWLR